jgi:hypothetical protein
MNRHRRQDPPAVEVPLTIRRSNYYPHPALEVVHVQDTVNELLEIVRDRTVT